MESGFDQGISLFCFIAVSGIASPLAFNSSRLSASVELHETGVSRSNSGQRRSFHGTRCQFPLFHFPPSIPFSIFVPSSKKGNRMKPVASSQHHGQHLSIHTGPNWNWGVGVSRLSQRPEFITSGRETPLARKLSPESTGKENSKAKTQSVFNQLTEPILMILGSLADRDQCVKRLTCKSGSMVPVFRFRKLLIALVDELVPESTSLLLEGLKAKIILNDDCSRFNCFSFSS